MESTINFGIDLGTTNSAIAKFVKGEVIIFNNPLDYGRATLPSVVLYRKDKIVVGTHAKQYLERDPKNVVAVFKRKMGTSESYKIKSTNESVTPIELSAQVRKQLKTFVNTGDTLDAVVLTIPASFDMIQSNATKEAGHQAGFGQVVLLQEPIAASLAYANMKKVNEMSDGKWLVYDLGGGTFDVALLRIKDGEMKVLDHRVITSLVAPTSIDLSWKLIIPKLSQHHTFDDLYKELTSASGRLNGVYFKLCHKAEEAKVKLSAVSSAEIEVNGFEDASGEAVDIEVTITRSEFNELIKPHIDSTLDMIKAILTRNSLTAQDVEYADGRWLDIHPFRSPTYRGGATDTGELRDRPDHGCCYRCCILCRNEAEEIAKKVPSANPSRVSIRASYNKASKERDELFAARVMGITENLLYRIVRQDGGFDSGLKKLTERISEDLPLVENAFNYFTLTVYDAQNNPVETDLEPIGINSGFAISGQPLPEDICLEVDDLDHIGSTRLFPVFERNTILPAKKTVTFPINKTLIKGNDQDRLWINVYEGPQTSLPSANKPVGIIEVTGRMTSRDVAKGSDIEITISVSESRDLTVSAYLTMSDQEFKNVFNSKVRETHLALLKDHVNDLVDQLDEELEIATDKEEYETASHLAKLKKQLAVVAEEVETLSSDDVTDKRYQLEDRKRKIAQDLDVATKDKRINKFKELYVEVKEECRQLLDEGGNDHERNTFKNIIAQEPSFLSSNNPLRIQEKSDELQAIIGQIRWRTPKFLLGMFKWLSDQQHSMNDQTQSKSLIEAGRFAVESSNWERLREINFGLLDLLPKKARDQAANKIGFGL
ncbi:MAG: Hsp70 family protein [Flavobacteriales bacterium]|nr:Hsp70 family protein [Flavobacteriales bacterium]